MRLPLALRNITRHGRRTGIGLSAIAFGVVAMVLAGGFFDWILRDLRESTIQSRLGHIQITKSGFREFGTADPFTYLLDANASELTLLQNFPQARTVASRIMFSGVISHGDTSVSFLGEGVEPDKEQVLSKRVSILQGANLSSDAADEVLLGAGLATSLGVKPGDTVVLLATASSGGTNGVEVKVSGLFATYTKAYDDSSLRVPLPVARKLLRTSGAHRWVVLLNDTDQTAAALSVLRQQFANSKLEVTPWFDLADFYNKLSLLFVRQVAVIRIMIALIVLLSISNTMVMSVLERTGEIGTLMALGLKRKNILGLFIAEGFFLGVLGGIGGIVLGIAMAQVISAIGIPMPPPPGSNIGFTAGILISWPNILGALLLVMATTLLASIYPAWKASRMEIVDSLRHYK